MPKPADDFINTTGRGSAVAVRPEPAEVRPSSDFLSLTGVNGSTAVGPATPPDASPHRALFDATFYLEQNPDVAAAGLDPLEHYDTYGWRESRDPSASFDTSFYLESNPDVAAAGLNPLEHYARYGDSEGRASSPPPGSDFINTTGAGGAVPVRPDPADPGGHTPIPTEARRSELKEYAEDQLEHANKAQAFVNILDRSTGLVKDVKNPSETMIKDLVAVLVGEDRKSGFPDEFLQNRLQGPHLVEGELSRYAGSDGFQPQFQDDSFQVYHAMAGIAIGTLNNPFQEFLTLVQEWEPQDIQLYEATFEIGNNISDENYDKLPEMVADEIGDETVVPPLSDFILIA